jgi:flavin-dependent dehydrogenase
LISSAVPGWGYAASGQRLSLVLVVGGGIAGFAMMRALDQQGISAGLVDRLNGPPDAGLGLNLPGNAVRALRDLGVDEKLKERACRSDDANTATPAIDCCSPSTKPASGVQALDRSAYCAAMFWSFSAPASRSLRRVGAQR